MDVRLQTFSFQVPAILPFGPHAVSLIQLGLHDSHVYPRHDPEGQKQIMAFFEQEKKGEAEWSVKPACGVDGCWNRPRPLMRILRELFPERMPFLRMQ